MDILNKIFEVCIITIGKKQYRLKYPLSAVVYLENKGIKIESLTKSIEQTPLNTIYLLAFAGLPKDEFRENITFEAWLEKLTPEETKEIMKKMSILLTAFLKDLGLTIQEKSKKEQDKKDIKKKSKKLLILLCVVIGLLMSRLVI